MYFLFYTDKFLKPWAAGCALGPVILIRPKYKGDKGLLAHEKVHVKQFWYTFGFMLILNHVKKRRYQFELEAYKEQLKHSPEHLEYFAWAISERYGLDVSNEQALRDLTRFKIEE